MVGHKSNRYCNNEGALAFEYNLEDTDTVGGSIVYNGQSSVLWQNIRDAFKNELKAMYISLRSTLLFNYEHVRDAFLEHQSVWPERIWNEDAFTKYLQPFILNNRNYLDMLLGDKSSQRDWWLYNAFKYRDSKYGTGSAKANRIILRGYIDGDPNDPNDAASIASQIANANITVTPYAHIYASVLFGSYTLSHRMERNQTYTFMNPLDYMNDTEIYLDSADQLRDVGDLSVLRLGKVADFSAGIKLEQLVVGSSEAGYQNNYLQSLNVGNNELLKSINVCNCKALATTIDLSGCTGIETVLATGSVITGVNLPIGGHLKRLDLPATITNFTVRNQINLTTVNIAGYTNLTTLRVENTPNTPIEAILTGATNLNRVRLIGVEWTATSDSVLEDCIDTLDDCIGMDVNGNNTAKAVIVGRVNLSSINGTLLARIQEDYPDLVVVVNGLAQYIVKFYNTDNTLLYSEVVAEGDDAVNPVTAGYISAPTQANTDEVHYVFNDFGTLPTNVNQNSSCVATYTESYRVRYMNDSTVMQSGYVTRGGSTQYSGTTPTKAQDAQYTYTFNGWSGADNASTGAVSNVTQAKDITATFTNTIRTYTVTFKNDDNSTVLQTLSNVAYGTTPSYTGATPTSTDASMGAFMGWTPALGPITGDTVYVATYVPPVEDVEISGDWASIIDEVIYGTYAANRKVGNYKALDLSTEGTPNMQIVAIDTDVDKEGNTVPLTFIAKECLSTSQKMNSTDINTGGYPASAMKTYMSSTILNLVPSTVKPYLAAVAKISKDYNGGTSQDLTSYERAWIPSGREVGFSGSSYEQSGPIYNLIYKNEDSRIKTRGGSADFWWLRSARTDYSSAFSGVYSYGASGSSGASGANGVALGFSVAPDTIRDSWDEISDNIKNNTYTTKYSIGDTKAVDMGDQGIICFQIAAFDTDVDANGNTIPITWVAKQIMVTSEQMNSTGTNSGGYPASAMKTYVDGLKSSLPATLQAMIVAASKTSRYYNGVTLQDLTSTEELWIPSYREIFGGTSYEQSGPVYSSLFSSSSTRIKKKYGTGSASFWWLRSVITGNASYFGRVNSSGNSGDNLANYNSGVVLGFCTGARGPMDLNDTWDDVNDAILDGTYTTKYQIGDTIGLDLGNEGSNTRMQIAAFDTDVDANGNTIPITFISKDALATSKKMNSTSTNTGGYPASAMKTYVDGLKSSLPATLQSMIVAASKTSRDYNGGSLQDLTSNLELWIPSYREVSGGTSYEQSGPMYSNLFTNNSSRIKKKCGTDTISVWWLRSAMTSNGLDFRYVKNNGAFDYRNADYITSVVLGFCVKGHRTEPADLNDTWDQVDAKIANGTYATEYVVGDTIPLSIGSNGSKYNGRAQIVAIDGDVDANGNTIPLTFITVDQLNTTHNMNSTSTNAGGYPASAMKTYVDGLKSSLPATLQSMIVAASKTSKDYNGGTPQDLTNNLELWIPSVREVFGGTSYEQSGPIYNTIYKDNASRIKTRGGSADFWWLRSAFTGNASSFSYVKTSGNSGNGNANYTNGVVLGFCTGAIPT